MKLVGLHCTCLIDEQGMYGDLRRQEQVQLTISKMNVIDGNPQCCARHTECQIHE